MGASLVVYIAKVPVKFDAVAIERAKEHAAKVENLVGTVLACLQEAKGDADADSVTGPLGELRSLMDTDFDTEDLVDFIETTPISTETVDELLITCNQKGLPFRDCAFREDPHNDQYNIIVAGDSSWGDDPEGAGYAALKSGYAYGLCGILGIL